ncbi:hypothetical protein [Sulfuricurvum sp.]|uniref:hypothetical protein n=1 Tax=Sulfuricurvum sp. TaxID=2025608 RepID=UPI00260EA9C6|nr:hypothetical protein [Sulfuricurvum sp.]MDD4949635.1 hypothetical protein [Sulfuricurvum sp.]
MITIKNQAQEIKDINNENRFIPFTIDGIMWHVMSTSVTGYSVVIKNNDVSIAFRKKGNTLSDRNPSVKIEYRAQFLVLYGLQEAHKKINDYFQKNIHNDYLSKTQEIHLASDIQGHTFTMFDTFSIKTRAQKKWGYLGEDGDLGKEFVYTSDRLETLYFGTSSNKLRIYDKTVEFKKNPDSQHIEKLWKLNNGDNYKEHKDVWRIEFQIRREKLKQLFTENKEPYDYTKVLLENLDGLWNFFITYFSYKDISEEDSINFIRGYRIKKDGTPKLLTKEAKRQIRKKAPIHPLWEKIKHFSSNKPPYWFRFNQVKESQPVYAMNAVCGLVSTITKQYGTFTPEILQEVIQKAEDRSYKNNDIGLIDKSFKKLQDYFAKVEQQSRLGLDIIETPQDFTDNFSFFVWDALSPLKNGSVAQKI